MSEKNMIVKILTITVLMTKVMVIIMIVMMMVVMTMTMRGTCNVGADHEWMNGTL